MMDRKFDILNDRPELKKNPYSVPEGYFEAAKSRMRQQESVVPLSLWRRLSPYAAMAAVFILMVSAGTLFLEKTSPQEDMTIEDYLVFSEDLMNTLEYEQNYGSQIADAETSKDDLINYLIYIGVTPEEIELSK